MQAVFVLHWTSNLCRSLFKWFKLLFNRRDGFSMRLQAGYPISLHCLSAQIPGMMLRVHYLLRKKASRILPAFRLRRVTCPASSLTAIEYAVSFSFVAEFIQLRESNFLSYAYISPHMSVCLFFFSLLCRPSCLAVSIRSALIWRTLTMCRCSCPFSLTALQKVSRKRCSNFLARAC